jgi:hypothetical protein
MTSFFGGDPNVSHFTAGVTYLLPEERFVEGTKEGRARAPQRRREQSAKLKELGFKTRYFQFRNGDEQGKARAKAQADAEAKLWSEKAGFQLTVAEGCFL